MGTHAHHPTTTMTKKEKAAQIIELMKDFTTSEIAKMVVDSWHVTDVWEFIRSLTRRVKKSLR